MIVGLDISFALTLHNRVGRDGSGRVSTKALWKQLQTIG